MEGFVAHTLAAFEQGKISRRKLIETLTLAVTAAHAADRASAAEQPGLKAALINHISYTCPNYRQAADLPYGLRLRSARRRLGPAFRCVGLRRRVSSVARFDPGQPQPAPSGSRPRCLSPHPSPHEEGLGGVISMTDSEPGSLS
jgi:hypothetical protein